MGFQAASLLNEPGTNKTAPLPAILKFDATVFWYTHSGGPIILDLKDVITYLDLRKPISFDDYKHLN
jgi:hypothetical protein